MPLGRLVAVVPEPLLTERKGGDANQSECLRVCSGLSPVLPPRVPEPVREQPAPGYLLRKHFTYLVSSKIADEALPGRAALQEAFQGTPHRA